VALYNVVADRPGISDGELLGALRSTLGIAMPHERDRIVRGIAWMAKSSGYLERDDEAPTWRVGPVAAAPDRRWKDWTFADLRRRAAELNGAADALDTLTEDLFTGKPNKTVVYTAKTALAESAH
jgi:hypothetical protein